MDFLANENIPLSVTRLPTESGHSVVRVADEMPGASDRQVLEQATRDGRIVLTFDRDYGESILKERRVGLAGQFTVVERDRIRQRSLGGKND